MTAQKLKDLPVYLQPKLRLFLSADLVGSTAFKQGPQYPLKIDDEEDGVMPGPHWLASITNFYADFGAEFATQWKLLAQKEGEPLWGPAPEFWKGIGDEVVYVKDLHSSQEVAATVLIWLKALRRYRAALRAKNPALDIKATVWTGGFPVNNSEVVFDQKLTAPEGWPPDLSGDDTRLSHFQKLEQFYQSREKRNKYVRDFIGTSVDTGFRLSSKSTPRKMSVSIEIVLMATTSHVSSDLGKLKFFFDGYDSLKGVLGGRPYPLFWIDLFDELSEDEIAEKIADKEDALLRRVSCKEEDLRDFCELFIKSNSQFLVSPFIYLPSEQNFKKLPENYLEKLWSWKDKIDKEKARLTTEAAFNVVPPSEGGGEKTKHPIQQVDERLSEFFRSKKHAQAHAGKGRKRKRRRR